MATFKYYDGTKYNRITGGLVPKTTKTVSDTETYSCNYVNEFAMRYKLITGLSLTGDSTYKLSLPDKFIFAEPLLQSNASDYSGGQFVTANNTYSYITSTSIKNSNGDNGVYIRLDTNGTMSISSYKNCGAVIRGVRLWYYDNK